MRALLARSLEEGRFRGPGARVLSFAWERASASRVVRPLSLPGGMPVVCVGGATLGGSGKTPLAIACARELARGGARTVLVGHAYGARPGCARRVSGDEPVDLVGDEAIVAARALKTVKAWVVVAPTRRQALELAARAADVVVLDGVLQTSPRRAWLSWLAVDAERPWGNARAVPPVGDLRAPVEALLEASDRVVHVGDASSDVVVVARGAWTADGLLGWDELRRLRVGLACALARPDRLVRFLQRRGITPVAHVCAADHRAIPVRALSRPVDLWLASPKCALHVPPTGAPLGTLDHDLVLAPALASRLALPARLDR